MALNQANGVVGRRVWLMRRGQVGLLDAVEHAFCGSFVPVDNNTQLRPGDQAMCHPGGRGKIVYDDECTDPVEEGKVVVVQDQSPCVGAASWWGRAEHVGLLDYAVYTLPGAAVIGGLLYLFNDDDGPIDRPASP